MVIFHETFDSDLRTRSSPIFSMSDETYTTFNVNYDQIIGVPTNANMSVSVARWDNNSYNQILAAAPSQAERLRSLFNLYQQFRIKHYSLRITPRYTRPVRDVDLIGDVPPNTGDDLQAYLATELAYTTLVSDEDDMRPNPTFDEYFQMRDQPNAKTSPWNAGNSYTVGLKVMGVIAQETANGVGNVSNITPGDTNLNMTAPRDYPWMSTKAAQGTTGSTTIALNLTVNGLGIKLYIYYPFWPGTGQAGVNANAGLLTHNIMFEFKYPDYRPINSIIGLRAPLQVETDAAILARLSQPGLTVFDPTPTFITKTGALEYNKSIETGARSTDEEKEELTKRQRVG